ncbi:MAG: FliA/WhiG family RNA polymerase sigma factor [Acidobacteriota bacterium]|nr:FliA/WhiG family RNA polymerase sigma factor [Acidobacteriota bacterium]
MPTANVTQSAPASAMIARETTQSERDELVLRHLPLVRAIAIRVYENLPVHVDVDDLVHAGVMGLFDAALKYDGEKQVSFHGYARHRIKGAILDSLRDMDWASRDLRKRHKQLEAVTRELSAVMERQPTEAEIADKMGMDVTRWRQVAVELRMVGLLSASSRAPESENQNVPEFPATDRLNPDVLTGQKELRSVLSTAIQTLPERYQIVIGLYYLGGKTMREIGDKLGINESRVSQIHRAALDKMSSTLQAAGIHSSECLL